TLAEGRATRLLDAAHIRPVGANGSDSVTNGLSLTPTVHRLFDEGLVSARWVGPGLELIRSPKLEPDMIVSPERGTIIRLVAGTMMTLPSDRTQWPSHEQIRFHQQNIFKGPVSLLS
ncbi:MAG: HNH endonuclease, partial [Chloroflexi bacterium]|nr:HNH endonuclease [Chloroflexota bacterium]